MSKIIDALLVERTGCERSGKHERVTAIDAQLRALGYQPAIEVETAAVEPKIERSAKRKSKKREA